MADGSAQQSTRDVFARRLRELRITRGFRTARGFAAHIGIDENRYTRYERGEVEPTLDLITRFCEALSITPNILFGVTDGGEQGQAGFAEASSGMPRGNQLGQASAPVLAATIPPPMSAEAWELAGELAARALSSEGEGRGRDALRFLQTRLRYHQMLVDRPLAALSGILQDAAIMGGNAIERANISQRLNRFAAGIVKGRPQSDCGDA